MKRADKRRSRAGTAVETPQQPAVPVAYPVWDTPTRLAHWAITVLFAIQFLTGQFGLLPGQVHLWLGYALLVAVLFRLGWGLVGSDSARLSHLFHRPAAIARYLRSLASPHPTRWPGHNPLGGLSAALLLLVLLAQCISGLFIETWGELRGPLAERIGRDSAIVLADVHDVLRWPLLLLVLVHVAATVYYRVRKSEDRIGPIFLHGRLALDAAPEIRFRAPVRAWLVLALAAVAVGLVIVLGPVS